MDPVIRTIRNEFARNADEKIRESGQRFFREDIHLYGLKTAKVRQFNKMWFSLVKERPKAEIFELCEELWTSGYLEESFTACEWSWFLHEQYEPEDFGIFEKWVGTYVNNWASCDTLCNHTVGEFIEMYPEFLSGLKSWAQSKNRWMRRASAVSLIIPARKGKFHDDILEIAGILLMDGDDMVQKGYGWMLKAASQADRQRIFDYVMSKKDVMPRTSLRYAVEKMSQEMRKKAMGRG